MIHVQCHFVSVSEGYNLPLNNRRHDNWKLQFEMKNCAHFCRFDLPLNKKLPGAWSPEANDMGPYGPDIFVWSLHFFSLEP